MSKYEAEVGESVVSLISNSSGYMNIVNKFANLRLLNDKTSSIYTEMGNQKIWLGSFYQICKDSL